MTGKGRLRGGLQGIVTGARRPTCAPQQKVSYVAGSVGLWRVLQSPLPRVVVISGQASLNSDFVPKKVKRP